MRRAGEADSHKRLLRAFQVCVEIVRKPGLKISSAFYIDCGSSIARFQLLALRVSHTTVLQTLLLQGNTEIPTSPQMLKLK